MFNIKYSLSQNFNSSIETNLISAKLAAKMYFWYTNMHQEKFWKILEIEPYFSPPHNQFKVLLQINGSNYFVCCIVFAGVVGKIERAESPVMIS